MTAGSAIVGAGPAGLTAAIAARRLGLEAVVYEQAPALGRVGGGIAIQNNGQRVLDAIGTAVGIRAAHGDGADASRSRGPVVAATRRSTTERSVFPSRASPWCCARTCRSTC